MMNVRRPSHIIANRTPELKEYGREKETDTPDSGNYNDIDNINSSDIEIDSTHEHCAPERRKNPSRGSMSSFSSRLATFKNWPVPHIIAATSLAMSGFFYTKYSDRVECFSCHGKIEKWEAGDDAAKEHKKHFPHCELINKSDNECDDETDSVARGVNNTHYVHKKNPTFKSKLCSVPQTAKIVDMNEILQNRPPPLTRTLFPQFCKISARQQTFLNWQCQEKPDGLAEAGFFSLGGARGETKCFYCGGGLRSWSPNDDPWVEHAKWFPKCEWLIRSKGKQFIQTVCQNEFPNLVMQNHSHQQNIPMSRPSNDQKPSTSKQKDSGEGISFEEAMQSKLVIQILDMGFDVKLVGDVVRQRLKLMGDFFKSATDLFDTVMKASDESTLTRKCVDSQSISSNQPQPSYNGVNKTSYRLPSSGSDNGADEEQLTDELKSTLENLKDRTLCKICMDNEACIVFTPCGHLVTCISCYKALNFCPVCRSVIKSHIKAYLA